MFEHASKSIIELIYSSVPEKRWWHLFIIYDEERVVKRFLNLLSSLDGDEKSSEVF